MEQTFPQNPQRAPSPKTPWFWTASLQNCKTINFCCFKLPSALTNEHNLQSHVLWPQEEVLPFWHWDRGPVGDNRCNSGCRPTVIDQEQLSQQVESFTFTLNLISPIKSECYKFETLLEEGFPLSPFKFSFHEWVTQTRSLLEDSFSETLFFASFHWHLGLFINYLKSLLPLNKHKMTCLRPFKFTLISCWLYHSTIVLIQNYFHYIFSHSTL